ncbi:MAG: hypothetical protein HY827_01210 [Actinobacteria bacterium]|nr:hypothetical protein [Actinomycetota bacterium]
MAFLAGRTQAKVPGSAVSASGPDAVSAFVGSDHATCPASSGAREAATHGLPFTPASPVDQRRAVTLLFLPGPIHTPTPVLTEDLLGLPGFSVGLFSPTIGKYSPVQMMLDISQGSRAASSLYRPVAPPAPGLIVDGHAEVARVKGWSRLIDRAEAAPANLQPGLLGCSLEGTDVFTAWVGARGAPVTTAIAAMAGGDSVRRAKVVSPDRLAASIERVQENFGVVVAELPPGGFGLGAIRRIAAHQPQRMLIVVQAPPNPARTRLLSIGVRGLGGDGGIKSASTRRDGLVASTDIAATILQRVGTRRPRSMQGRPIEPAHRLDAKQLRAMSARFELIAARRAPFGKDVLVLFLLVLLAVTLLGRLTGRRREMTARVQRLVGLSLLWLPAMLLVAAALRPSRQTEVDIAVFGSLGLALATDRFVRWPRAPWLPVCSVMTLQAIDFALLGSRFTGQSLLGSNPLYGARFFGAGNEIETVLTLSALLACGAFMCDRAGVRPARAFAAVGAAMAIFLGSGRLGADVGGVVMVAAGFGTAALYVARVKLTVGRLALLAALPVAALALIALLDAVTGGESHLTRTFQDANGPGDILTVVFRRFRSSVQGAQAGGVWAIVLVAFGMLIWGWVKRERLLAPLVGPGEDAAARRPYRAALSGGVAATVIGALANDSGPAIMIIGTIYLGTGVLYLRGRPDSDKLVEGSG